MMVHTFNPRTEAEAELEGSLVHLASCKDAESAKRNR